jgi:hypothetical protein
VFRNSDRVSMLGYRDPGAFSRTNPACRPVDFEGRRQALQPESVCRSDGSTEPVAQAVTSGLAVIRPKLEELGFPRPLFSMNA